MLVGSAVEPDATSLASRALSAAGHSAAPSAVRSAAPSAARSAARSAVSAAVSAARQSAAKSSAAANAEGPAGSMASRASAKREADSEARRTHALIVADQRAANAIAKYFAKELARVESKQEAPASATPRKGARHRDVSPDDWDAFERKCAEKEERERARANRAPAFRPAGGVIDRDKIPDEERRPVKYMPVVHKTPTVIARGRQRVVVEQDPETVALAEQRKEARPISHIGQETNGRTKVKTKGACWNSVFSDLRNSALVAMKKAPTVSSAEILNTRLRSVLPEHSATLQQKLAGHTDYATARSRSTSPHKREGKVFWRCGNNGEFQQHTIQGIEIATG